MADASSSGLITISCDNHRERFTSGLWHFFQTKRRVDWDVLWGGRSIRAHRLIMEVFLSPKKLVESVASLQQQSKPAQLRQQQQQQPPSSAVGELDALLEFLYQGSVTVPKEQLVNLKHLAKRSGFKMLVDSLKAAAKRENVLLPKKMLVDAVELVSAAVSRSRDKTIRVRRPCHVSTNKRVKMTNDGLEKRRAGWRRRLQDDDVGKNSIDVKDVPIDGVELRRLCRPHSSRPVANQPTIDPGSSCDVTADESISDDRNMVSSDNNSHSGASDDEIGENASLHDTSIEPGSRNSETTAKGRCRKAPKIVADDSGTYRCKHCSEAGEGLFETSDRRTFRAHQRSVHKLDARGEPIAKHVCSECDRRFESRTELKLHRMRIHTYEKPYKCSKCEFATILRTTMDRHVAVMHENIRAFMCSECGHKCATRSQLANHEARHTVAKPHVCKVCSRAYSTHDNLSRHFRVHASHDKSYVCHECGHAFHRQDHLKKHLRSGAHAATTRTFTQSATSGTFSANNRPVTVVSPTTEQTTLLPHFFGNTNFNLECPATHSSKLDAVLQQVS